jgi:hypothetical protein
MTASLDERLARVRAALLASGHLGGEDLDRVDCVADELRPFAEAALECAGLPDADLRWSEARSLALLFAYRLGDQGYAPGVVSGALLAWRDAAGEGASAALDGLWSLLLDGYARGREDRTRAALLREVADAAAVLEVAPRRWLVTGLGALDLEGARSVSARAASALLRGDAEAVLLDLATGAAAEPAAALELVRLEGDASALGVRFVIALSEASGAALQAGGWRAAPGTEAVATAADGMRSLLWAGGPVRSTVGWMVKRAGW